MSYDAFVSLLTPALNKLDKYADSVATWSSKLNAKNSRHALSCSISVILVEICEEIGESVSFLEIGQYELGQARFEEAVSAFRGFEAQQHVNLARQLRKLQKAVRITLTILGFVAAMLAYEDRQQKDVRDAVAAWDETFDILQLARRQSLESSKIAKMSKPSPQVSAAYKILDQILRRLTEPLVPILTEAVPEQWFSKIQANCTFVRDVLVEFCHDKDFYCREQAEHLIVSLHPEPVANAFRIIRDLMTDAVGLYPQEEQNKLLLAASLSCVLSRIEVALAAKMATLQDTAMTIRSALCYYLSRLRASPEVKPLFGSTTLISEREKPFREWLVRFSRFLTYMPSVDHRAATRRVSVASQLSPKEGTRRPSYMPHVRVRAMSVSTTGSQSQRSPT